MFKKSILIAIFAFLLLPSIAGASEGTTELRNQVGESARCYSTSILMPDQRYRVLVSCRDILYPGGTEVFNYVVWATPTDGGSSIRLGTLDLGKVEFKVNESFTSMFVTKELDDRPRNPGSDVVMRGSVQRITFLDSPASAGTPSELTTPTPSPTSAAKTSGTSVFRILAAGGIVAFLGLFGVILIIFVVTRR